jgi:cbb3-type cytochrome oxidase cytochrome c subunit
MMYIKLPLFIMGVLATLLIAWVGLTLVPGLQISDIAPSSELKPYTDQQLRGREVYIREGCIYCHSQQTRPVGFGADQKRNWGRPSVPAIMSTTGRSSWGRCAPGRTFSTSARGSLARTGT